MNYSDMIKQENTDSQYQPWSQYRKTLTDYISKGLASNIKKGSWIAIWGAGGCNDIDVVTLSKDYKLLLIDQDVEKLTQVRKNLGLNSDNCKVADVGFWSITDDDYEMFQALLMDKAPMCDIEKYFQDLIDNMSQPINLTEYKVECSVVVGLASQLNARFAAIMQLNKDNIKHLDMDRINAILNHMNSLATERLYISMRQLTTGMVITGYEVDVFYDLESAEQNQEILEEVLDYGTKGGRFLSGNENNYIKVAGNEYWHSLIYKTILMDKLEDIGSCKVINWPFSENKFYNMLIVSLVCVIN
ncbi:MAG: hypothetical protein J6A59_16850 [Lachnospiraceae bacterium]|nr:hypothetical protein [Lachnospiraceae bacterium]